MPASFGKVITAMGTGNNTLMPSKRTLEAVRAERHVGLGLVPGHRRSTSTTLRDPVLLGGRAEPRRLASAR